MNKNGENDSKKIYRAFGINISSDFIINGMLPGNGEVNVDIIRGIIEDFIDLDNQNLSENSFGFLINNIAKCHISNGSRIIIQPLSGASDESIRLVVLSIAINIVLLQRGMLPIHGSAVGKDGRCILISGASGAGKSTLTYALRNEGYSFISDDIAALSFHEDGTIWVEASAPQQKMWRDSMEKNGFDINEYNKVIEDMDKYFVPVDTEYKDEPVLLSSIIELAAKDCKEVSLRLINGPQKLDTILRQTYRSHYVHLMGLSSEHFSKCSTLAKSIPVYQLTRPSKGYTTEQQIVLIKELSL